MWPTDKLRMPNCGPVSLMLPDLNESKYKINLSVVTEDQMQTEGCAYTRTKEIIQGICIFCKCIAFTLLLSASCSVSILIITHDQNETICVKCLLECVVHGKCSVNASLLLLTCKHVCISQLLLST